MIPLTDILVAKYEFRKYPRAYEDYTGDAIVFALGHFRGYAIEEMKFFPNGVVTNVGDSTDLGVALFDEVAASWVEFGLRYSPDMLTSRKYLSELTVHSDALSTAFRPEVSRVAAAFFGEHTGMGGLQVYAENSLAGNINIRIEPLLDSRPEEHKFWCMAPLATARHVEFLTDLERALS